MKICHYHTAHLLCRVCDLTSGLEKSGQAAEAAHLWPPARGRSSTHHSGPATPPTRGHSLNEPNTNGRASPALLPYGKNEPNQPVGRGLPCLPNRHGRASPVLRTEKDKNRSIVLSRQEGSESPRGEPAGTGSDGADGADVASMPALIRLREPGQRVLRHAGEFPRFP